jgi:hypothetical protein
MGTGLGCGMIARSRVAYLPGIIGPLIDLELFPILQQRSDAVHEILAAAGNALGPVWLPVPARGFEGVIQFSV